MKRLALNFKKNSLTLVALATMILQSRISLLLMMNLLMRFNAKEISLTWFFLR